MICYGGDQAWFDSTVARYSACGTVAAANVTAYLAAQHKELAGLYKSRKPPQQAQERQCFGAVSGGAAVYTKTEFLNHMQELYRWVTPWKVPFVRPDQPAWRSFGWGFGVWPARRFTRGVERFARSRGIRLRSDRISSRRPLEELTGFIEAALRRNCPVAMLIGRRPRYEQEPVERPDGLCWSQTHFSVHWVVITAMENRKNVVMVKVSTWGGWSWLNLNEWHAAGGVVPALAAFVW